jgi:4-amino-4-deoxy-L-arabinose transferase-like glycosyltransferase
MFLTNKIILLIILLAFFLRLYGSDMPFFINDDTDWILLTHFISFDYKSPSLLPFGSGHGPLTAYLVKFSGMLFGQNPFGWRAFSILFGTLLVLTFYLITQEILGESAANFAAYLGAVNILFIFMSKYATDDIFSLFFFSLSLLFFVRALSRKSRLYMILTGISLGLGLLTKESLVLLCFIFPGLIIYKKQFRFWLKEKVFYLSVLICLLISSPYALWLICHKFYFFHPAVKEAGQWFSFFNFPVSIIYLFLGQPNLLFDSELALGYHFVGPGIGILFVFAAAYCLKVKKNDFLWLMNLIFWIIVLCAVLFFRGIPRQFIIILIPATVMLSYVLDKLWQKNYLFKLVILAMFIYFLIYAALFTFHLDKRYALHSKIYLPVSKGKSALIDLNRMARVFSREADMLKPSLLVFPDSELDPIDNFVSAYYGGKTVGTSPENRFLPYNEKDFKKVAIFSILNADLNMYAAWSGNKGYSVFAEERKLCFKDAGCLPLKIMVLLKSGGRRLTPQDIEDFVTLSIPFK